MEKVHLEDISDFQEGVCFTSNWSSHYWKVLAIRHGVARLEVYNKKTDELESEIDWTIHDSDLNGFYYHKDVPQPVKYGKIIRKIQQMDARRKELGYVF